MRISDWSSDVCSSDLRLDPIFDALAPGPGEIPRTPHRDGRDMRAERGYIHAGPSGARSEERRVGKEVSVRVDLGGRRIIKKKRNKAGTQITIYKMNNVYDPLRPERTTNTIKKN